jgi:hypothetical protein
MYLLQPSPPWFPYFGNQRRFAPYVLELLVGLGAEEGDTLFETNAGSHAISYAAATKMGLHCIANDLGYYSASIGRALTGDGASALIAARGAALIEMQGYNPTSDLVHMATMEKWVDFIEDLPKVRNYVPLRGDLFEMMEQDSAKFIYCDFAWPWKDGTATKEYETSSDTLGTLLGDEHKTTFKVASARRILRDVITFLDQARKRYEFVILSNQSSNYPTPEVIEAHMRACGHVPIISRRLTVPAEHVDDLGKEPFFTEFQYVFEGTRA